MDGKLKALLSSALVIGMVAAVSGSGVFAAIRDLESSRENVLQGGSIDLKTDGGDGTVTFTEGDVKPCPHPNCEGEGEDLLINIGENPGELSVEVPNVWNAGGRFYEPEVDDYSQSDEGELGKNALMAVYIHGHGPDDPGVNLLSSCDTAPRSGGSPTFFAPINSYEGCRYKNITTMEPGSRDEGAGGPHEHFRVEWTVPSDTGKEIMGDQVFVDFLFELLQKQG